MTIEELKKKYADKKFIEVDSFNKSKCADVKNVDDLMPIDDTFLYMESFYKDDEAVDFIIDSAFDFLEDDLDDEDAVYVVREEFYDELCELANTSEVHLVSIRAVHNNVGYFESSVPDLWTDYQDLIMCIIQKYNEVLEAENDANEERVNEAENYVLSKKDEYKSLSSVEDRDNYISNLRYSTLNKFKNSEFILESKFTKDYIRYLLSDFEE